MTVSNFSTLVNGQHLPAFNPDVDRLNFDATSVNAADVRLTISSGNLGFSFGGKTVWLDGMAVGEIEIGSTANVSFANGSVLSIGDGTTNLWRDAYGKAYDLSTSTVGNQVWGLFGADSVSTGSGGDWLVGNTALTTLNHVSRAGSLGSPTGSSGATVSADGRYVAFAGGWTGYGSIDNNAADVIVKDISSSTFSRENLNASGIVSGTGASAPVISADGTALVFHSSASNLVDGPASGANYDVYLTDVQGSGIVRVSTSSTGVLATDGQSRNADVSPDGTFVAFHSTTSNWFAGGSQGTSDVFLKNTVSGVLTRISTSLTGTDGNAESEYAKVSADGRYVVFQSFANNLTAGDTNGYADIFLWDRNATSANKLTNLTATLTGTQLGNQALLPDIAADGSVGGIVVFETARGIGTDDNSRIDIYAYNLKTKAVTLVSSRADGSLTPNGANTQAQVSGDGRFVVFSSSSDTLVPGDTNGLVSDVFVKDLISGQIALVSRSASGVSGNAASNNPQISLGGDWIVFESGASNLAGSDGNSGLTDVFRVSNPLLRDTLAGGAGNDTYVVDRADLITELANAGTDTVQSSLSWTLGANLENLTLTGTAGLSGTGNGLSNIITGNSANNVMNGGDGIDTASYAPSGSAVTVSLAVAGAQATGFGSDTLINFENLTGSALNDRLTGNSVGNRLDGGLGNDTLTGGGGGDTYVVGSNADVVVESGTNPADIDSVVSTVSWTLGSTLENLTLSGSTAVNGGGNSLANVMNGNAANNTLNGFAGNDSLKGNAGNDSLLGGTGNDTLDGGAGSDTLVGDAGSDTYVADVATDIVSESGTAAGEIDTVLSAVNWTLGSTLERLTLTGSIAINGGGNSLNNQITGNGAANGLTGSNGNDTLNGGNGNDTLTGGAGNDSLSGGGGNDVFALSSTLGSDTVSDFDSGADDLRISQSALRVGDGDLLVEGAVTRSAPGGFAATAELVIFSTNVASFSTSAAAAAIGSATGAYGVGAKVLFALDTGASSALFMFTAADANATVSAGELTLLATLAGTESTVTGDYVFGA